MIGDKYGKREVANISVDPQALSLHTQGAGLTGLGERWKVCVFFRSSTTRCTFPIRREAADVAGKDGVLSFSAPAKHAVD